MSLQVWLPLLENTNNQGLSEVGITGNNLTYGTGPLGSSIVFNGNTSYVSLGKEPNKIFTGKPFSISFWLNSNEEGSRGVIFSAYSLPSNSEFFSLEINSGSRTDNSLRFVWKQETDFYFTGVCTPKIWIHIVVTYDGNIVKCYKNGTLFGSQTISLPTINSSNDWYLGRDSRTGATALNGSLCDFRIYDHVLSAKEVKEISKALTIHLPLKGMNSNPNLYPNSLTMPKSGSGGSFTQTYNTDETGCPYTRLTCTAVGYGPWFSQWNARRYTGQKFTLSCYLRANKNVTKAVGHESGGRKDFAVTTEWKKFTQTWTASGGGAFTIYNNWAINDWVDIKLLKIEEGDKATPWCPCVFDTDYSKLGYGTITTPYTLVGGPSNTQGYISGFTTAKYINSNTKINWNSANTWDVYCKFTTGTDITTEQYITNQISGGGSSVVLGVKSSKFTLGLGTGTSWDLKNYDNGTFTVEASKTYYVKVSFNGTAYTVSHSITSFASVTLDYTFTSSTKIANDSGNRVIGSSRGNSCPWLGSIDMESFKICLNGNPTYIGAVTPISTIAKEETSGYNRAVTLTGRVTPVSNTPKDYGVNFIGGNIVCSKGFPTHGNMPTWSISLWYRPTGGCTFGAWCDVFTFWINTEAGANTQFRLKTHNATGNTYTLFYNNSGQSSYGFGTHTLSLDTWHHMTFCCDGAKIYHYVNGALKSSGALNTGFKPTGTTGQFRINDGSMFADYSDVRVYGTCLSADDIKKLYNTPIAIDNTGKLFCNNLVEE